MQIIVELLHGHWSAWFAAEPGSAFGGDTAAAAASRLLEANGINPSLAQPIGDPTPTRMELRIPTDPCPDCHGSGKYTGLNSIDDCRTCGGSGVRIW